MEQYVEDHLFGDGVADLYGTARKGFALAGQLGRTERGAVDPVAPGPSADGHGQVARLGLLERHLFGDQPHVAAVDKRVAQVAGIEIDGPVHGRDAHAVAIVTHASDDTLHHLPGMEHARWQLVRRCVRRCEAEHIRVTHRFGAHARAHRVSDHAADSRVGAAVGLQG